MEWTSERLKEWIEEIGDEFEGVAEKFLEQRIDGMALVSLEIDKICNNLEIKDCFDSILLNYSIYACTYNENINTMLN